MFVLYQITNLKNSKYYIGAHTCADDHECFANGMCTYMGSGRGIKAAIKKYGPENFKKDILADVGSAEFLYQLEAAVVDQAFVNRKDTYNNTIGGNRPPGNKGVPRTAEWRRNLSVAKRGNHNAKGHTFQPSEEHLHILRSTNVSRQRSPETRRRMSLAPRGRKRPPLTEEHRQKLRIAAHRQWERQWERFRNGNV